MADPARGLERLDRWADSARLGSVLSAMRALHAWPDSGEAAVRLARIVLRRCLTGDSTAAEAWTEGNWRWSLAHTIAYRGHLHESVEAYPYLGIRLVGFFGGVPRDSFNAVIRRHNAWPAGLPAWAHRGDTALLGIARVRFDSIARAGDGRPLSPGGKHRGVLPTFSRRLAAYDARRAQVYLTLARGDTTGAIQGFRPLIDSLCVGCSWTRFFTDVYVATQLLHARGGDTAAAGWMDHVNVSVPYPGFDVALSHAWGRVKEALGDREGAARAYDRVVRMWAGGDPEILPMVKEARAGLHRLR